VVLVALAAAGTGFLYARETVRMGAARRAALAGVRVAAFSLLGFLLLRPVWVTEVHGERARAVVLLLDNSQSLAQPDPRTGREDRLRVLLAYDRLPPDRPFGQPASQSEVIELPSDLPEAPTRADLVRAVLTNPRLNLLERLARVGPLQTFLFGQRLRAISAPPSPLLGPGGQGEWLGAFTATDSRTALADACAELLERDANELPAAVVVVTDGRDNASELPPADLARACAAAGVPLHIYGPGVARVGHAQLRSARIPDTLFVDDEVEVPVRWRVRGVREGTIELSLRLSGRTVGEPKRLPVREGDDLRETLTFTPTRGDLAGGERQELEVVLRRIEGGETFTDTLGKRVLVEDRKVRVLVVEDAPRWEYQYLQRALLRDRRVEADFVLLGGDPRAMQAGPPYLPGFPEKREAFFAYDLLILGDVPASLFGGERLTWLREFVAEGRGLVMIAGPRHAPAEYAAERKLAEVLPVEFGAVQFPIDSGERTQEYRPQRTPAGARSGVLQLADVPEENDRVWEELRGWHWHYPVKRLRPGAVALLTHPREKAGGGPMPLMASHYYGRGLVMFLATDETWRWRYNEQDRYFNRFWAQVVYRAGYRERRGSERTRLSLSEAEHVLGRTGRVYARLFTPDYRPLEAPRVSARLEKRDAKPGEARFQTVTLEAVAGQPGDYVAVLPHDRVGEFTLTVEGSEAGSLDYRV
ncbi:MAG TPA: hypothetical protein VIL46_04890, partial [Gemmataceae bacterium]